MTGLLAASTESLGLVRTPQVDVFLLTTVFCPTSHLPKRQ